MNTSELGVCLGLEFRGTSVLCREPASPAVCCCGGGTQAAHVSLRKRFPLVLPLNGRYGCLVLVLRTRRAALD